jgi:hypothetical protein
VNADVSKEHFTSIFLAEVYSSKWSYRAPPKQRYHKPQRHNINNLQYYENVYMPTSAPTHVKESQLGNFGSQD